MSEQSAPSSPSSQISAGQMLRRAREQQQLSAEQIASRLNLRPSLVTDMEADDYAHLQIVAYRRGYLRAYARLLKIDDTAVIAAHDREHGAEPQRETQRTTPIRPIKRPSRIGRLMFRLVTLAIIMVLGFMTLNWWRNHQDVDDKSLNSSAGAASQESTPPSYAPGQQPANNVAPAHQETTMPTGQESQEASSPQESMQVPVSQGINGAQLSENSVVPSTQSKTPVTDTAMASTDSQAATPIATASLALSCRQDCWTQIRDAAGTTLQNGLLKAGAQHDFNGKAPYRVVIGNVAAATLSYEGQPVDLKKYARGGNVARFNLGQ